MMRRFAWLVVAVLLLHPLQSVAQTPGIVGSWRNSQGSARFNADGTGVIDGKPGRYQIAGDRITLIGAEGMVTLQFSVRGDMLTLIGPDGSTVLSRVRDEAGAGSVHQEMVGKWCWIKIVNAQQGGMASDRCFTLAANGTYQYVGNSDSYNPNGGVASQSSDSGTWTATETTLTAHSRVHGTVVHRLEKRNHPKTGDPMLVVDGDPFVTYYQHPRW